MKYKIPFMTLLSFNIIAISAFGWFFINGTKQRGVDERTSIILSTDEKDYILYEMRGLLEAIGEIVTALSEGEFAKVSSAAWLVGAGARADCCSDQGASPRSGLQQWRSPWPWAGGGGAHPRPVSNAGS